MNEHLSAIETIALTKCGGPPDLCGPEVASVDEISSPVNLSCRTGGNDIVNRDGSTSNRIFSTAQTFALLSRTLTLMPGDIVSFGVLPGVGLFADPRKSLGDGDLEINGVGKLPTHIGPLPYGPVADVCSVDALGGPR